MKVFPKRITGSLVNKIALWRVRLLTVWHILTRPKSSWVILWLTPAQLSAFIGGEDVDDIQVHMHRMREFTVRLLCNSITQDFDFEKELAQVKHEIGLDEQGGD